MKIRATDNSGVTWEFEVSLDLQASPQRILFRAGELLRTAYYSHSTALEELTQDEILDYFCRSVLTVKVEQIRQYTRGQHRFFDELISFLAAFASLATALRVYIGETSTMGPRQGIGLQGSHVTNLSLFFAPIAVLGEIAQNRLPTSVQLIEKPRTAIPPKDPLSLTSVNELSISLIGSAFIRYYESVIPLILSNHGGDPYRWPGVLNFGRIIRNALVHNGGRINFKNPSAQPVNWKSLSYAPIDNGRQVMFVDLTSVEIILLMEDMDATI